MNSLEVAIAENCDPPSKRLLDRLEQNGVDLGAYLAGQLIGLARVRTDGRRFRFDPDGKPALVNFVRMVNPWEIETTRPTDTVLFGPIVDVVAWDFRLPPERFFLYRDAALWLGAVLPQYLEPDPVPVHRGVLGWLKAGCRGIVLLGSKDRERQSVLARLARIEAEDPQHERELRRIASMPIRTPEITARQPIARAA